MCNCQIVNNDGDNEIEYCPLHAAAPKMLEALTQIKYWTGRDLSQTKVSDIRRFVAQLYAFTCEKLEEVSDGL